ncbi:MAG: hypothetical protein J6Z11_13815 [Candidatus Riflebacteria bacterium]|nr:hypothetical protein [Candidatus Riflebacteria bacterium]
MEEIKGKKPQEKVERFLIEPHYTPLFGLTVTKNTEIDDVANEGKVHQTIKDLVFITEVKLSTDNDGLEIEEESKLTIKLPEGTRLIWTEDKGYIIPDFKPVTRKEIKEDLDCLNGIAGLE